MPEELKRFAVSNAIPSKEVMILNCKACNDTPVYQTSINRFSKPEDNVLKTAPIPNLST